MHKIAIFGLLAIPTLKNYVEFDKNMLLMQKTIVFKLFLILY